MARDVRTRVTALVIAVALTTTTGGLLSAADSGKDAAKKPASRLLVSAAALEKSLGTGRLRVLDTRRAAAFAEAHIPGAQRVDVNEWTTRLRDETQRVDAKLWGARLGALGIDASSRVVVCGRSPVAAARLWWTLRYLGVRDVAVLDGGWSVWLAEKRPTTNDTAPVAATRFVPRFETHRLASTVDVKKSLGDASVQILDTRSLGEWNRGRIPGATRLEWKELMTKDGRYRSTHELNAVFAKQGLDRGKTTVPY